MKPNYLTSIGLLLIRLPIGALFALAGWGKIHGGVGAFVQKMIGAVPPWLPHPLGSAYLHALPFAELTVGICLVLGLFTRIIGAIASLMLVSFIMAVTHLKPPQSGGPFDNNLLFLGITLGLALAGAGRLSLDGILGCCCKRPPAPGGEGPGR
jgi:uncharacterized membrane protein YphA (DoxX/SURF4 family)